MKNEHKQILIQHSSVKKIMESQKCIFHHEESVKGNLNIFHPQPRLRLMQQKQWIIVEYAMFISSNESLIHHKTLVRPVSYTDKIVVKPLNR